VGPVEAPPVRRRRRAAATRQPHSDAAGRAGAGERARARRARASGAGLASARRPKGWPRPVKAGEFVFLLKEIFRFYKLIQIQILKMKKAFSQVVSKTKVVQNLILYNFHLGHLSKF
jgi:hypothetical protein